MKAAVIYQHGGAGSIQYETHFADPMAAPDEVVVKVHAATMNYHDIFTRNDMPSITAPMTVIIGLGFVGEIVDVGREVTEWRVGDRVMVALTDDVRYDTAACLPVAYGTDRRMMMTIGKIKAGEKVLILGASGGVGTCCVQLAKLAGTEVVAAASIADKLEITSRVIP